MASVKSTYTWTCDCIAASLWHCLFYFLSVDKKYSVSGVYNSNRRCSAHFAWRHFRCSCAQLCMSARLRVVWLRCANIVSCFINKTENKYACLLTSSTPICHCPAMYTYLECSKSQQTKARSAMIKQERKTVERKQFDSFEFKSFELIHLVRLQLVFLFCSETFSA